MKKIENILWGLAFIVVGVIIALNTMGIANINIFFNGWWTLFIIVPCFIGLFKNREKTGDIIGLIIGVVLLLSCQDILEFNTIWKLLFPSILIVIGLSFIFKDAFNGKVSKEIKKLNSNKKSDLECAATFSSENINFNDEEFKGIDLTSVFGSIKCDLTKSIIKSDVIINAEAIFGGIEIIVPKNVEVKVKSTSIFGGTTNKTSNNSGKNSHVIYVNSTCLFGGIEIK